MAQSKEAKNEYNRRYYQRNKLKWKGYNRTEGAKESRRRYEARHKETRRSHTPRYFREWRKKLKYEIMSHYSEGTPKCKVCGENRIACLSIDHIYGGGEKAIRDFKLGGGKFYSWIKKNNYPKDLQVLCMNCQFVKRVENRECFR